MTHKTRISLLMAILSLGLVIYCLSPIDDVVNLTDPRYYIAHAAGSIDGHTYTNSQEALQHSLLQQFAYIELDLQQTIDGVVVCSHDCVDTISNRSFLNRKILGKYTPLSLQDALQIRKEQPFTLVTDKIDDPNILNKFFTQDKSRLIVEVFSWQRYSLLKRQGYHAMLGMDKKSILHYFYYSIRCGERIEWITSSAHSHADILKLRVLKKLFGVKIAFVPLNFPLRQAKSYIGKEFDLIYVEDMEEIKDTQ